jgi:hypothetical protein
MSSMSRDFSPGWNLPFEGVTFLRLSSRNTGGHRGEVAVDEVNAVGFGDYDTVANISISLK